MAEVVVYNKFKCKACGNEVLHLIEAGMTAAYCHFCNEKLKF